MQVILKEDYPSLGFIGDLVNVKPGFARNFLFPKKIALPANKENVVLFNHQKKVLEVKKTARKAEAEKLKDKLEGVDVIIRHLSGEGDRLFGSVTVTEIHEKIKEAGFDIDRRLIRVEGPIKTLGEHKVEVKLHQDVVARLTVTIQASEGPKKAAESGTTETPKRAKGKKKSDSNAETQSEEK